MIRFVTGGAGFIGVNFLFYLRRALSDDRLVCIDKLTYAGNLSTPAPLLPVSRISAVARVDICDREAVYALFAEERLDVVINFAAESHVDRSIADPSLFFADEHRQVRAHGRPAANTETSASIRSRPTMSTATCRSTGRSCCSPSRRRCTRARPYSSSKAAADLLVGAYGRTYRSAGHDLALLE